MLKWAAQYDISITNRIYFRKTNVSKWFQSPAIIRFQWLGQIDVGDHLCWRQPWDVSDWLSCHQQFESSILLVSFRWIEVECERSATKRSQNYVFEQSDFILFHQCSSFVSFWNKNSVTWPSMGIHMYLDWIRSASGIKKFLERPH